MAGGQGRWQCSIRIEYDICSIFNEFALSRLMPSQCVYTKNPAMVQRSNTGKNTRLLFDTTVYLRLVHGKTCAMDFFINPGNTRRIQKVSLDLRMY